MAFTLTRSLKLRVDSNLTSNAKYNLAKIDDLASIYTADQTDSVNVRAKTDINLLPEDSASGGSGIGGTVNLGTASQYADEINLFGTTTFLGKRAGLLDQGTSGNKRLYLKYDSTLNGAVDTVADRTLSIDLDGGDRSLILAQSLSVLGGFATILRTTGATDVTLPLTGTLATLAGVETLTNKTIDSLNNTITNINNSNVSITAGIAYAKLNLTNGIVNADVNSSAAIAYTKLALANSIINGDISAGAAIAYSKLNLSGSLLLSDLSPGFVLPASSIDFQGSIVDADVASGAAIAGTKITPDFGNQEILTSNKLSLRGPSFKTSFQAAGSGTDNDYVYVLPPKPVAGVLATDSSGTLSWVSVGGTGTVTSVDASGGTTGLTFSGGPITASGTLTLAGTLAVASGGTGATTAAGARTNLGAQTQDADLDALAALATTGLISRTGSGTMATRSIAAAQPYVSIANGDGVSGNPTVDLAITAATSATPANNDEILIYDVSASAHRKVLISDITSLGGASFAADWTSGTTTTITHNLGSRDVLVELYDNTTFETILVDSIVRTSTNAIDLTASSAPSGSGWRVLIKKI